MSSSLAATKPTLGYWSFRGLGQPARLLLAYLGVEYENKLYTSRPEWREEKFNLGLEFPNIPYWIDGEVKLTELKAILKYLARKHSPNLLPATPESETRADVLEGVLNDIWWSLIRLCFDYKDELKASFEEIQPVRLQQLSNSLGTKKWILGDNLSYLDFLLYEVLFHHIQFNPDLGEKFPNFSTYIGNFEKLPKVATYISSPEYISSPCNSPRSQRVY